MSPAPAPAARPARLLVVAAGPGDADLAMGGTVARWVAEGPDERFALIAQRG